MTNMNRMNAINNELNNLLQAIKQKAELLKNCIMINHKDQLFQEFGESISFYVHFVLNTPELAPFFKELKNYRRELRNNPDIQMKLVEATNYINEIGRYFKNLPNYSDAVSVIDEKVQSWHNPFSETINPYINTNDLIDKMANVTDINGWNYKKIKSLLSIVAGDIQGLNGIYPYYPNIKDYDITSLLTAVGKLAEISKFLQGEEEYKYKFSGAKAVERLNSFYLTFTPNPIGDDELTSHDRFTLAFMKSCFKDSPNASIDELLQDCDKVHTCLIYKVSESQVQREKEESIKILFLVSNPVKDNFLKLDEEIRDIEEGIKRSKYRSNLVFVKKLAVRPLDLNRALLEERPTVVHFSGHGVEQTDNFEGAIVLQDDNGNPQLVPTSAIGEMFRVFGEKIQGVVLNSCYSISQANEIIKYVPYVIANNTSVGDRAAIAFAINFYDAIGAGNDIEFAFKYAKACLPVEGLSGNQIPVLYKNEDLLKE